MFRNYLCKAAISICISALAVNSQPIQLSDSSSKQPIEIVETMPLPPSHQKVIDALKAEIHETRHWDEGCYDDTIQLTQEDAWLLMQIASAEALNQGQQGMVDVMTVIVNRVRSDDFPDTVLGVVSQEGQFDSFKNGSYLTAEITPECHLALATIEKNMNLDTGIVAFETAENGYVLTRWFDVAYQYRDHVFYKQKKH